MVSTLLLATKQSLQHSMYTREASGILQQAVCKCISRLNTCGPKLVNYLPSQAQGLQCMPSNIVPVMQKAARLAYALLPLAQAGHGIAEKARLGGRP